MRAINFCGMVIVVVLLAYRWRKLGPNLFLSDFARRSDNEYDLPRG